MSEIIIYDKYCQIQNEEDEKFLSQLDRKLSFHIQGAEYSFAYKSGRWDGIQRILTSSLKFPYGLLTSVKESYQDNNKIFEIIDRRTPKQSINSIDIYSKLKEMGKEPFPYQLDVLEKAKQNDCGIIRVATGGGKSLIAALITAYFGKPTILYVVGIDLLYQMHKFFSQIFDQKIGIIGDGICDIQKINIVSVWTAAQTLGLQKDIFVENDVGKEKTVALNKYLDIKNMLAETKVHIFDECHQQSCASISEILKNITPDHIYGMSASPFRDDGTELLIECSLGRNIVDISASFLIERGYLVKPIIKFIKVPPPAEKIKKSYQTIYKNYIINNSVRNDMILTATQKLVNLGYVTLVMYNSINHGQIIYDQLSKKIPCILLSGDDSSEVREDAINKIQSGEVKCILASKIWDIGVDLPCLSGLVLSGSGKSSVRALQRIGRVIRKFKNKSQAAVVDFYDDAPYLKDHTKKRISIYKTEPAFEIHLPKG